jgi:hypothetical protein
MRCDLCGSPDYVGVACVPAFPVSLAWCKHCLAHGAMPLFCAEATLCLDSLDLRQTKEMIGLDQMLSICADWFLDAEFWIPPDVGEGPGRYVQLRTYLASL